MLLWAELTAGVAGVAVGLAISQVGVVLVALMWWLLQIVNLGRDSRRRGILSRRHTLARAYLALPMAVALAALGDGRSELEWALVTLTCLGTFSLAVRLALANPTLQRRWGLDGPSRLVLVGTVGQVERALPRLRAMPEVHVIAVCPTEGGSEHDAMSSRGRVVTDLEHLPAVVADGDVDQVRVLPGSLDEADLEELAWELEKTDAHLVMQTSLAGVSPERLQATDVGGAGVVIRSFRAKPVVQVVRAALDRILACLLLAVAAPIMTLVAAIVRIDSPGPALFPQTRVGLNGNEFTMLKFRTMVEDAEQRLTDVAALSDHGVEVIFKMKEDPRVTRVGRWLRATSLDELPQLINVVRGEMSLIGPRPALPREVERYDRRVHRRLAVKPGLTGLWQVSGRSRLTWDESVRIDLDYVDNWTAARDLKILARTVRAVIRRDGAY